MTMTIEEKADGFDVLSVLVLGLYKEAELTVPEHLLVRDELPRLVASLRAQGMTARFGFEERRKNGRQG